MSQTILEKILIKINDLDTSELIKFLLTYKKNEYIYPSVIKNKFKYTDDKVYKILNTLEEAGILKMYYEYYCYNCDRNTKMVECFNQIEVPYYCDNCGEELHFENVKVVFKVIC